MSTNASRVNRQFTTNELQDIDTALDLLEQSFPFFRGLSPRDLTRQLRIGTSNQEFVQAIKLAVDNLNILPGYLSTSEFENEFQLYFQLDALIASLKGILEKLIHTQIVAGNHLMNDSLDVYHTMEAAVRRGIADVVPFYKDAQKRFDGQGRVSSDQEDESGSPASDNQDAPPVLDPPMGPVNGGGSGGNTSGNTGGGNAPSDPPVVGPA